MSRRSAVCDPFGDYPTPGWCVDRLYDRLVVGGRLGTTGRWLEPCAGAGGIPRRFDQLNNLVWHGKGVLPCPRWAVWEVQHKYRAELSRWYGHIGAAVGIGDALSFAVNGAPGALDTGRFDVVLTNPPYHLAFELLKAMRKIADQTIFLLRTNFLASEERHPYWASGGLPREILQLPNRPKFVRGRSDSTEYSWFRWGPEGERVERSTIEILDLTSLEDRQKWEAGK